MADCLAHLFTPCAFARHEPDVEDEHAAGLDRQRQTRHAVDAPLLLWCWRAGFYSLLVLGRLLTYELGDRQVIGGDLVLCLGRHCHIPFRIRKHVCRGLWRMSTPGTIQGLSSTGSLGLKAQKMS